MDEITKSSRRDSVASHILSVIIAFHFGLFLKTEERADNIHVDKINVAKEIYSSKSKAQQLLYSIIIKKSRTTKGHLFIICRSRLVSEKSIQSRSK